MKKALVWALALIFLGSAGRPAVEAGDRFIRTALRGKYDLDALYSYPVKWGMAPAAVAWSPDGRKIAFLWNTEGSRFRDVYFASIPGGELARGTNLRGLPRDVWDDDPRTQQEKDEAARYDPGVSSLDWSPDGSEVVFTYRGDLFSLPSSGPSDYRRLTHTAAAETQARFSPGGKVISFVRAGNLWAVDRSSGALRQLTSLPAVEGLSLSRYGWSPDGTFLFLTRTDTRHFQKEAMPDYTLDRVVPNLTAFRNYRGDSARAEVGIVRAEGGGVRWVDFDGPEIDLAGEQWSPDGSRLLVSANRAGARLWTLYAIFDRMTLEKTALATDEVITRFSLGGVSFTPDGKSVLFPSYRDGWLHLYAVPAEGGPLTQLTRGAWDLQTNINSPRFLDVPARGGRIYFTSSAVHPLEKHLFSLDLGGGEPERLSQAAGTYTPYASPDGRYVVVDYSAVDVPNDLYLIDSDAPSTMKRITSSPLPAFKDVVLTKPRYFSFTHPRDGVKIHYRLLAPPGFDERAGRRYPVVFTHLYVDEGKNIWTRYRPFEAFLSAEMNYLVVSLDGRGSSGQGRAFADGRYPRESTKDVEDHLEAAKYLKTLPYVDPKRVGCWGKSYGGDLALAVLFQEPGVFDTSVSIQPVTWRPRSMFRPERLSANLLLIHSLLDNTVYFREMALMMQMLIDAGKYADFWLYPKEDHSLALRDESFKDALKRVARYFEDHWGARPAAAPTSEDAAVFDIPEPRSRKGQAR